MLTSDNKIPKSYYNSRAGEIQELRQKWNDLTEVKPVSWIDSKNNPADILTNSQAREQDINYGSD